MLTFREKAILTQYLPSLCKPKTHWVTHQWVRDHLVHVTVLPRGSEPAGLQQTAERH